MTSDRPDARDLLRTAMAVFKDDLLPEIPERRKLDALMVLNVLGIAERALADDGADEAARAERLRRLGYSDAGALARAIREGAFDDPADAARLHAELTADVRARLALSNPKYLAAADAEDGRKGG